MSPPPHPEHDAQDLCPAGTALYERALRQGGLHADEAAEAPCLAACGLLRPSDGEPDLLTPAAPAAVLHRLLRASAERVARERRGEELLTRRFAPLLRLPARSARETGPSSVTLVAGTEAINQAITDSMAAACGEMLCIQPPVRRAGIRRSEAGEARSLVRDQDLLDRGGRIRTLYQHTHRHLPLAQARYEQLRGDVEARTLDEVTDRLIVIDRAVAYLPADEDSTLALEVRQPALVSYLVTVFERLWPLAVPMHPKPPRRPAPDGITHRQHAIAALLVEGHTDAVIADRLGMNIRTAREHIARLAATLGSTSRAQLGYLIARSGILKHR
ncbi:helix-turn-helix transcriptional regulator [Streptomyces sp. GMY01]|uniref:helix-turn-helix transcriptional regulator n=1 Tax=Streptomyces sp. GMY02 TaxID=1333528 RepID=UPI00146D5780|nr:helix-turn-helix transcriptional regulator [Streptomyces sp. GMY02]NMO38283.1 helix-turn-helix transcriptional regulator [Streptomyces sp. GMY02]